MILNNIYNKSHQNVFLQTTYIVMVEEWYFWSCLRIQHSNKYLGDNKVNLHESENSGLENILGGAIWQCEMYLSRTFDRMKWSVRALAFRSSIHTRLTRCEVNSNLSEVDAKWRTQIDVSLNVRLKNRCEVKRRWGWGNVRDAGSLLLAGPTC